MLGSESSPHVFMTPLCSETAEKEAAARRYEKLQAEGKTDQAIKDLARLEIIRKQREESKKKREAEEAAAAAAGCILYSAVCLFIHTRSLPNNQPRNDERGHACGRLLLLPIVCAPLRHTSRNAPMK